MENRSSIAPIHHLLTFEAHWLLVMSSGHVEQLSAGSIFYFMLTINWISIRWCLYFISLIRCKKWLENCHHKDLEDKSPEQLYRYYRLCAKHFEPSTVESKVSKVYSSTWSGEWGRACTANFHTCIGSGIKNCGFDKHEFQVAVFLIHILIRCGPPQLKFLLPQFQNNPSSSKKLIKCCMLSNIESPHPLV